MIWHFHDRFWIICSECLMYVNNVWQGCQIKSNSNCIPYQIESFRLYRIVSNANWIEWNFGFSIQFDSIWSVQKGKLEKPWTVIVEKEEFTKRHHKSDYQIFLPSWWTIPLWNWPTSNWPNFSMTAEAVFVSNQNRIERFLHFVNQKSNQIKSKPIRFDGPKV
jgi:hypothetical protein